MSSMVVGGNKSTYVRYLGGECQKPFVLTSWITINRNGHSIRPNRVALKDLDF
jgi:hypothetical protein